MHVLLQAYIHLWSITLPSKTRQKLVLAASERSAGGGRVVTTPAARSRLGGDLAFLELEYGGTCDYSYQAEDYMKEHSRIFRQEQELPASGS